MVTLTIALTMNVICFSHYTTRDVIVTTPNSFMKKENYFSILLLDFSQNNEHTK